jgi:hypothetical protein
MPIASLIFAVSKDHQHLEGNKFTMCFSTPKFRAIPVPEFESNLKKLICLSVARN